MSVITDNNITKEGKKMPTEGNMADLADEFSGTDNNVLAEEYATTQPEQETSEDLAFNLRVNLLVKKLPNFNGLPNLNKATVGSAGIDLYAANHKRICLNTLGAMAKVPTGIAIELPVGFEVQIRPRSGLAAKNGVTVLNAPGTIDSDYRGEIFILLVNLSTKKYWIERGDRIAQMVLAGPIPIPQLVYVNELSVTKRDAGGFGSSG